MNDETPGGTILSRIRTAAGLFASGNKMKYQGIAELYAVYLEAKVEPSKAAEIEAEYSTKGYPKTDLLTNMVLWLGFPDGADRRRISDMHLLLLECENQNKLPSELVEWFVAEGGWRKVLSQVAETKTSKASSRKSNSAISDENENGGEAAKAAQPNLFKAFQSLQDACRYRKSSTTPPIPVAADVGEYLVQVCLKEGASKFVTYWVKLSQAGIEPISVEALKHAALEAA